MPFPILFRDGCRRLQGQKLESLQDAAAADVDRCFDAANRQALGRLLQRREDILGLAPGREGALDEVIRDLGVLPAAQQHAVGRVKGSAGASHLLVVGHHGTGGLVMDDEGEVRFVEAHPQGRGRHQRLHLVVEQGLLQLSPARSRLARIGLDLKPARPKPRRHRAGVTNCQRVDDAAPRQLRQPFRQPGEPLGLARKSYGLQRQRRPGQIAAGNREAGPEDFHQIVHDAVVRGRGRRQQAKVGREVVDDAFDQTVVRPEVVAPIRDAVRLVDHEERYPARDLRQHLVVEALVREPLRGDEQDVHFITANGAFNLVPVLLIVGIDRGRPDSHPIRRRDLISHQRQQRTHQQRGSHARLAQQLRRDEVDEALAPSGLLHDEQAARPAHHASNGFELADSELRVRVANSSSQKHQGVIGVEAKVHRTGALPSSPVA